MMPNSTPLPPSEMEPLLPPKDQYGRFSGARKLGVLSLVSACGLLPYFVSGTFTPLIPKIAADLKTSGSVINLTISFSVLASSLGGLIGASYSTFYGRRPIYLYGLPIVALASFGVSSSKSIPSLLFWRFLQSVGASPALIIGAGVIGDIYRVEERGRAMGTFFAACLVGPAIAPFMGGSLAQWSSWRVVQAVLGLASVVLFVLVWLAFPETFLVGERGVDKVRAGKKLDSSMDGVAKGKKFEEGSDFVCINPFASLVLLRRPNLLIIAMLTTASQMSCTVLLTPLAYTVGERYNIKNSTMMGACFLPAGLGNMLGALLVGRLSDQAIIHHRSLRPTNPLTGLKPWYPEDRLRAALPGFGLMIPIAMVGFAATNVWVGGRVGLAMEEAWLLFHGIGEDIAFGPCAGYLVDVMQARSAEGLAANK